MSSRASTPTQDPDLDLDFEVQFGNIVNSMFEDSDTPRPQRWSFREIGPDSYTATYEWETNGVRVAVASWYNNSPVEEFQKVFLDPPKETSRTIREDDSFECYICKETIGVGREIMKLKGQCDHEFCKGCLKRWFKQSPSCPMCRSKPTEYGTIEIVDRKKASEQAAKA